ncbi:EcsC protein family protein [Raineyella antarctica]|uniref:EcsC protein family protein n=1 Tax=Raineyella antarctica TaxID=1577474 RepID=A0A1G6GGR0_9ACTN|nr:EcsC family protein [Raineyella antarctica]SDB80935.1 EcsC protein family protein [Raineyella antarctica]
MADQQNGGRDEVTRSSTRMKAGTTLRTILDLAIDGSSNMPGAKSVAAKHLQKHPRVEEAVDSVITAHIALASTSGFLTNVGGLVVTAITLPANLMGLAVLQGRMVASIAHLRGYDIDDTRVRTAIMMCMMGADEVSRLTAKGKLPGSPLLVATAPIADSRLNEVVSEQVVSSLLTMHGGKTVGVMATKRIPVIGGGIGAVFDGVATRQIGKFAKAELVQRRAIT